jgi:magnesium chelatase subunit D
MAQHASAARPAPVPRPLYPFSAIVGQERMKLALLLNAVDPAIGGVLIRGEKGTAKSTAARALAQVLPEIAVMPGCPFSCDPSSPREWCPACQERNANAQVASRASIEGESGAPAERVVAVPVEGATQVPIIARSRLVTLPLNATEDMIAGSLDFSTTMSKGARVFQPGLLAKAHRGILYIDEVNLLDDHLVDVILDAAGSGINIVEREGLSFCHAAQFAIVASMNPEEGSLRPQLLDRFGLCVEVVSETDLNLRVLLMERREAFETDPGGFCRTFADEESALSRRIVHARSLLPAIRLAPHIHKYVGELAMNRHVAGHRADLVIARAAAAFAALEGRSTVDVKDVLTVAEMALLHRSRDASPPSPSSRDQNTQKPDHQPPPEMPPNSEDNTVQPPLDPVSSSSIRDRNNGTTREETVRRSDEDARFDIGGIFTVKRLAPPEDRLARRGSGRRTRTRTEDKQGRYVRSRYRQDCRDVALDATLRACAPHQVSRRAATSRDNVIVYRRDWREKVREKRIGSFILFVVDASGSMGSRGRMVASKGAVMSLLLDAYQKRDRVAMIIFRRKEATLLLPPTSSIEVAGKLLQEMPVGGRTPLSAALVKAYETLAPQLLKDPNLRPLVILVTDGKANIGLDAWNRPMDEALHLAGHLGRDNRIRWIVVDTEEQIGVRFGLARRLASALGGEYYAIDDLKASCLVDVAKGLQA